ncbi:hypothetical protein GCM10027562_16230 [Arthrobacter pigmenti]
MVLALATRLRAVGNEGALNCSSGARSSTLGILRRSASGTLPPAVVVPFPADDGDWLPASVARPVLEVVDGVGTAPAWAGWGCWSAEVCSVMRILYLARNLWLDHK